MVKRIKCTVICSRRLDEDQTLKGSESTRSYSGFADRSSFSRRYKNPFSRNKTVEGMNEVNFLV